MLHDKFTDVLPRYNNFATFEMQKDVLAHRR